MYSKSFREAVMLVAILFFSISTPAIGKKRPSLTALYIAAHELGFRGTAGLNPALGYTILSLPMEHRTAHGMTILE